MTPATIHASAARFHDRGILILGESGSGKSSLLLALMAAGGTLVADDRVVLAADGGRIVAVAPEALAGCLEVRGVGIVRRPFVASPVDLVVELRPAADCPRLPDESEAYTKIAGVRLPRIFIASGSADGPARVAAALGVWP